MFGELDEGGADLGSMVFLGEEDIAGRRWPVEAEEVVVLGFCIYMLTKARTCWKAGTDRQRMLPSSDSPIAHLDISAGFEVEVLRCHEFRGE